MFALCGYMMLAVGDAIVKSMVPIWPATAIAALRYFLGAVGIGILLLAKEGRSGFVLSNPLLHLGRAAAVSFSAVCFFMGVKFMPLAEATAISFMMPMFAGMLSAVLLREKASRATWLTTAVAFVGVLIILRPNVAEVGLSALFPLGSAIGMAVLILLNRRAAGTASVLALQFNIAALSAPMLIAAAAIGDLSGLPGLDVGWPHWSVILRCAIVAVSASCAHALIFLATTRASAATIAPMTYSQLIVALIIGALVFGDLPDLKSMFGSALIVGSGLYLWRSATPKRGA
jgi:drug/metabolite transporter (DMT)-like permease